MPIRDPDARKKYHREWVARRRAEFFDGKSCVRCGSTARLELDHINPADKISHHIWSWAKERREAEIAKCQVLCRPCHEAKGIENGENVRQRGVSSPNAKLNDEKVISIRAAWEAGGVTKRALAAQYGVDEKVIRLIVCGQAWSHVGKMNRTGAPDSP